MCYALITGASSGLGYEFAKLFAADGHAVVLVARRRERLETLARELESAHSIKTQVIDMDLAQADAGRILFERIKTLGLEIDFLVNNAAFGSGGKFAELPLNRELEIMDLNMKTVVQTTHLFLAPMLQRGFGRILNVGSLAGFQPGPYMNTYSASKAFVNSFSEALNEELKGTGVTCTVLAPGLIATEFQKAADLHGTAFEKQRQTRSASPAFVASVGYRAMMRGQALTISGFLNWLGPQASRFAPRALARKIAGRINQAQL